MEPAEPATGTPLAERIEDHIGREGPLPFDRFMQMALYDPDGGYYGARRAATETRAGPTGDFITAPTLSPLFGAALARLVHDAWIRFGRPERWNLVEVAGGTGALIDPLLRRLHTTETGGDADADADATAGAAHAPRPLAGATIWLIDPDPVHRRAAAERIATATQDLDVAVFVDETLPSRLEGPTLIIANELLDNLPFKLAATDEEGVWHERCVGLASREPAEDRPSADEDQPSFTWTLEPPSSSLAEHLRTQPSPPILHQAEVPVGAKAWLQQVDGCIGGPALVLLIDYGMTALEMYTEPRTAGTLTAFQGHQRSDDVLDAPGTKDITAHVDFTAVGRHAQDLGWRVLGYNTQGAFLMELGIVETAARLAEEVTDEASWARMEAVKQLFLPGGMGERFQAMLLGKTITLDRPIMGFAGAREWDPRPRGT